MREGLCFRSKRKCEFWEEEQRIRTFKRASLAVPLSTEWIMFLDAHVREGGLYGRWVYNEFVRWEYEHNLVPGEEDTPIFIGFRDLKDFIRVAPVFHWRYRRVKAHIFICVLALLLERYLEQKMHKAGLNISARKVIEKLKNIKVVTNRVGPLTLKYVTPPNQELEKLLMVCGIYKLPKILNESIERLKKVQTQVQNS